MKKTTISATLLFLFSCFANAQDFQWKPRPQEFENMYTRNDSVFFLKQIPYKPESREAAVFESKLPYPIIFVHGLNSSSDTWNTTTNYFDSQYTYTYGGRFDFCLNADGNNSSANKNFYPTPGADIAAFEPNIIPGDYYYVNFNVKANGQFGTDVLSNQSAITKQGLAVKKAVERVLQLTGKDKVILVGHSMGGLASREYIQNSVNWQADGRHHVAKLLTVGTPHGGSNASDSSLAIFTSVDRQSEAIRDLKSSYYYSGEQGRFLFGGTEIQNSSNMNDNSYSPDFYNVDINCNGTIGDAITGLNQKPIDNLIDFSSVIGRITNAFGSNITTDGVVDEPQSKMQQYLTGLTYPNKIFYFNSGYDIIENHTELPGYYYQIMQGLDEPNVKELAYEVALGKTYNGYTSIQEAGGSDTDFFKFTIIDNYSLNVNVTGIVTSSLTGAILNSSGTLIGTTQTNSGGTLNFSRTLAPGTYFLRFVSASPTNTNYQTPYKFTLSGTLGTASVQFNDIAVYPNPVKDKLSVENVSIEKVVIYNIMGQELKVIENNTNSTFQEIDMYDFPKGVYIINLHKNGDIHTMKIVKD